MSLSNTAARPLAILLAAILGAAGCASSDNSSSTTKGRGGSGGSTSGGTAGGTTSGTGATGGQIGTGTGGPITPDDAATGSLNCKNLQCYQTCKLAGCKPACAGGATTTVSGSIYDPAGVNPLYNIIVYVPNEPLEDIPTGATCDACGKVSGAPVTSTLTDSKGQFKLENVPATSNVPLVIQVGKWRRVITLPNVNACTDNPLTDRNLTRLPRDQSEGHLPRIALTTGNADALECLLRKVGVADSEFTPETGKGRVNFYAGEGGAPKYNASMNGGASFTAAPKFWDSVTSLKSYDMVLLSCEGVEKSLNKSPMALQAMQDYANAGGRIFASHWHNFWLEFGPQPFPTVAVFSHQADLPNPFTADIDMTFPKGLALAEWLKNVGSAAPLGQLVITEGKHTINRPADGIGQRWVYSSLPVSTQYMSLNTPVGVPEEMQCGRIVMSDIHVSSLDSSTLTTAYPDGCKTTTLSDQEKALEFMLFDLSACVTKDSKPPIPPK